MEEPISEDKIDAEYRAVDCFGTTRFFEKKRKIIGGLNKMNKYIGLVIPVSIGLYYTLSKEPSLIPILMPVIPIILPITVLLNAILLFVSLWALVDNWDIKLEKYTESITNNMRYYRTFKEIIERYEEDETKYASLYRETKLLDDMQQDNDCRENFSVKDRQFITRHGLHHLSLKCPICNKVPDIKKSEKCSNCGT